MGTATQVQIRSATAEDASAVAFVLKQAFAEYEPLYTKLGYAATTPERAAILTRMQEGPLWVALHEGHVVGTAAVVRQKAGLYIRGMAVLPAARGLSVGRLLLEQIEACATEYGCERLFLSTTPFLDRAIRLYKSFGFRAISDGPHELFGTPLFTMEKRLAAFDLDAGLPMPKNMDENTLRSIRESYDRLADAYTRRYVNELQSKPLDRELLNRFAAEVQGRGDVCDMGCGMGHIARFLRDAGARVFGLDLSPGMVEQALKLNPDISFQVGDMLALTLHDDAVAGIVAFYAIVNIPPDSLPTVFQEMLRVLQPGGLLLLSFHIGDEILRPDEVLGQRISMDFFFFRPSTIRSRLEEAGFVIEDVVERGPYAPDVEYQSRRAYIFARKPG